MMSVMRRQDKETAEKFKRNDVDIDAALDIESEDSEHPDSDCEIWHTVQN